MKPSLPIAILLLISNITSFGQTVTGTGAVNYVPKFTGTSTVGNSSIFDNGTNAGIGTTSPGAKLEVSNGTNSFKLDPITSVMTISGPASTLSQMPRINYSFNGDANAAISYLTYSHDNMALTFDAYHNGTSWISSHVGSNFAIYKSQNELVIGYNSGTAAGTALPSNFNLINGVRFSKDGKLGIGTSPAAKLEIAAGAGNENIRISAIDGSGTRYLSSLSFDNPAISYHAWKDDWVQGATSEISFLDRPGTSSYPASVRTSDILFKTAHNWNGVAYGQYLDNTMTIKATQDGGYVGIGTTAPVAKLDITGNGGINVDFQSTGRSRIKGIEAGMWFNDNTTDKTFIGLSSAMPGVALGIYVTGIGFTYNFLQNGNFLIGKTTQTNSSYKLDVNGNVRANKLTVNTTGADFVFEPNYNLPTLKELEVFVQANHHLPGISPAKEMQEEGMELGENQTKLLQKVEELTLYAIEQDKNNNALQVKVATQSEEIKDLKEQLLKLSALVEKIAGK